MSTCCLLYTSIEQFGEYGYGWHDSDAAGEAAKKGIDENVVREISADKHEPEWMLDMRLRGYRAFIEQPMPKWGVDLSGFHAQDFKYYVKPVGKQAASWEDLPEDIRTTYDCLLYTSCVQCAAGGLQTRRAKRRKCVGGCTQSENVIH